MFAVTVVARKTKCSFTVALAHLIGINTFVITNMNLIMTSSVLEHYSSSLCSANKPVIMFALQELLDVKMSGCSLIVWLKDKVYVHTASLAKYTLSTIVANTYVLTVLLNYNFIFTHMSTLGAMRKLQYIPITCLRGPRFLVAWNIHVLCNLPYATRGITMHEVAMHVTAAQ